MSGRCSFGDSLEKRFVTVPVATGIGRVIGGSLRFSTLRNELIKLSSITTMSPELISDIRGKKEEIQTLHIG